MKGKVDIISSLTPPSIHDVWLNLNDNKFYRYGANGWMSLLDNRKPGQSGGSTNLAAQSDWLVDKPVLPEYIKNRTHYLEVISTYNKQGVYDFPGGYRKKELKFALINNSGEDIIVDVPEYNTVVNINEYIRVDIVDGQFRLQELILGYLETTPLKIVVINKHLNENYLPEDIKADFMQPDENKQSFIRNNPFFIWREIEISSEQINEGFRIDLLDESSVYVNNGRTSTVIDIGYKSRISSIEGDLLAEINHRGTYLECLPYKSSRLWIGYVTPVANWDTPDGHLGCVANKPFNTGYKVQGIIGERVQFVSTIDSFNHDTLRLRYEGKYYRLPLYLRGTSVDIDGAFTITFVGSSVNGNTQIYTYNTQNLKVEGRDHVFIIESNIGATELCDFNIPNTIARNWKILKETVKTEFYYNPNMLDNHTYYIIIPDESPTYGINEKNALISPLSDVLEVKFFVYQAGSKTTPFSFNPSKGGRILWEGDFPELTGQAVEITIKYIGDTTLGSVKIYE